MKLKNNKFIYVSDIDVYNKLKDKFSLVSEITKDNKKVYILENKGDKLEFSSDIDISKVTYGNLLYI